MRDKRALWCIDQMIVGNVTEIESAVTCEWSKIILLWNIYIFRLHYNNKYIYIMHKTSEDNILNEQIQWAPGMVISTEEEKWKEYWYIL